MLKALLKDTMVYGVADLFFKLLGLLSFPIFAHVFSVEEYGLIALALTVTGFLTIFHVGLHNAVARFYWENEKERRELVTTAYVFLLSLTICVSLAALCLLYPFADRIWDRYALSWSQLCLAAALLVPSQSCSYAEGVIRLHFAPWKFTLLASLRSTLELALTLLLVVYLEQGVSGYLLGVLLANCCAWPLGLFLIRRDFCWAFDRGIARRLVEFGSPFILASVAFWIFSSMDRWMLGTLSSVHEVGLYSVALKIGMVMNLLKSAFGQAWNPHAYKIYEKQSDYKIVYSQTFSLWLSCLVILGACLCLFAPEFFYLTTPKDYWGASSVVLFSIVGMVFYGSCEVTALGISLKKKPGLISRAAWLGAISNLVLNYLWIPAYGAQGAAGATLLSHALTTSYYLYHSQRLHPIPLQLGRLGWILLGLLFMAYFANQSLAWPLGWWTFMIKLGGLLALTGCLLLPQTLFVKKAKQSLYPS